MTVPASSARSLSVGCKLLVVLPMILSLDDWAEGGKVKLAPVSYLA